MSDPKYDDGGRGKSVPVGPDQLPEPDPRIREGFGQQPPSEPSPVPARHPGTGQFQ